MMRFEYKFDDGYHRVIVELPAESTLEDVFAAFEGFLKAAGYSFDGEHIELVKEETNG